jgi:hypothetical protein
MGFKMFHSRRPIRRQGADRLLLLTLVSFGLSVAFTRLFLALTGYPQIGNGTLHVAHVLWGGLLLFVAALVPLVWINGWVFQAAALLSGVGVGLFIDEVGKFITQNNDYFFPLAAPIVYAFFLLTVMLYLRVRLPEEREPRAELLRALHGLEEVLEHDLDRLEQAELEDRLQYIAAHAASPVMVTLAHDLLEFLDCEAVEIAARNPSWLDRLQADFRRFETHYLTRRKLQAGLAGGLLALGILALSQMLRALPFAFNHDGLQTILLRLIELGRISGSGSANFFAVRLALESSVGMLLLIGASLLALNHGRWGSAFGQLGLLMSLTIVNLLVFYFDQFSAVFTSLVQLSLLIVLRYYRRRFLQVQ